MTKSGQLLLVLLLTGFVSPDSFAMECPLVVVTASISPVDRLTRHELRRLYLGVPYQTRSGQLRPVRNESDSMLREVFLQKVMFMSLKTYQHALATHLVQRREAGPAEYTDTRELIDTLLSKSLLVSYIWSSDRPEDGSLKTLLEIPCGPD